MVMQRSVRHRAGRTLVLDKSSNGKGTSTILFFQINGFSIVKRIHVFSRTREKIKERILVCSRQPVRFRHPVARTTGPKNHQPHPLPTGTGLVVSMCRASTTRPVVSMARISSIQIWRWGLRPSGRGPFVPAREGSRLPLFLQIGKFLSILPPVATLTDSCESLSAPMFQWVASSLRTARATPSWRLAENQSPGTSFEARERARVTDGRRKSPDHPKSWGEKHSRVCTKGTEPLTSHSCLATTAVSSGG